MGKGEYWRLIDSQGRPPGLLGMWPSRAVTFIENHDTGTSIPSPQMPSTKVATQRYSTPEEAATQHPANASCALLSTNHWDYRVVRQVLMGLRCCAGSTLNHWPFPADHLHAGYCYIITHPGSPCIFYDHFMAEGLGQSIREMIAVRKKMRLHCRSKVPCSHLIMKPQHY